MSYPKSSLYYREGNSDKVYICEIVDRANGFVVDFVYGRRGSTLKTGTKTKDFVSYTTALRIYNKLVQEKINKGYRISSATTISLPISNIQIKTNIKINKRIEDDLRAIEL